MCVNGAVIYTYIYIYIDNSFTTQGHMMYMILYNILYTHTYILLCFIMEYTMTPNVEAIEGCVLVIQLSGGIEQHHPQCTDSHIYSNMHHVIVFVSAIRIYRPMHVLQKPPVLRWWSMES